MMGYSRLRMGFSLVLLHQLFRALLAPPFPFSWIRPWGRRNFSDVGVIAVEYGTFNYVILTLWSFRGVAARGIR